MIKKINILSLEKQDGPSFYLLRVMWEITQKTHIYTYTEREHDLFSLVLFN